MAMMAKMRSLAPAFIIGVGVIFVLFMVVSDSNIMEVFGVRTNNVGSINGENITYKEFMKAIDTERENIKQQKGKDVPDDDSFQFRDQVWDALVTQTLLAQQVKKYGISVSDQEIRNILLGPNPPEALKRNFIDSTGKFNRNAYISALYNTQNSQALLQFEEYIRQTQLNQKLQSMLLASLTVSDAEVKRKFIDQTTKMNDQYALVSLTEFPDSLIKISEDDLNNYYNSHLDQYGIKAQRKVRYVLFPFIPSADDSQNVKLTLESILNETKTEDTTSFKTLVKTYSSVPYSKDTLSISSFTTDAADQLLKAKPGTIIGPVQSRQGYDLIHLVGTVPSKEPVVRASHILINQYGDDAKNLAEAMKIYDQIQKGASFSEMAKKYSKDPGSAIRGGDLGWFGKGQMVPDFEKAAFSGKVGVVQKPIKTNYGYHIIKVTGRSDKKYIVEQIVNPIKTSTTTEDQLLSNAKDFNYIANKDAFIKEAKLMKYNLRETPAFTKDAYYIPGIGVSKNLISFAFDNDLNSISDPIRTTGGYVVAQVSDVIHEGVKPFEEVKNSVKPLVIKQKKYELALEKAKNIKSKVGEDLTKAVTLDPKVIVSQTGQFSATGSIPGIGMDYNFIAHSLKLPLNKVSNPVKGERGYFLIKVLSRTPFDAKKFAIQKNAIMNNLLEQKKSAFFSEWLANLKKNADIVDHRSQFFGQ
jgi:parvulin-like peptidyl-prolyl isomerase